VRFVADESVDGPIVRGLRTAGHEVTYVAELAPGIADEAVLALPHERNAVLVTADKDFGELVFARNLPHAGVILIRLHGLESADKVNRVVASVADKPETLLRAFTVVDAQETRRRA